MTVAAIETTALGKRYGSGWALRDCSLRLPRGRVAALVGPNGAGKTTLLHLAVGLLRPDAGTVRVLGDSPDDNAELLARIGFVAQNTPLYAGFTATDLVELGAHLNPRWDSALVRDRLGHVGIPMDRKVGTLSGGQRAQVALSLALGKQPELLLLDEPVASLDPLARREFLQLLMGAVAGDELTVLLSSHLLSDLERVCDYAVILHAGRVQVLGGVDELLGGHRLLVGLRDDRGEIPGVAAIVGARHTARQSTLLVRLDGSAFDRPWDVHEVSLEDVVLAYLADATVGALPGPATAGAGAGR
jgi:ABC-2 type transport system ATP-binding protein